jgi:opacity protein-like surface antigen
MMPATALQTEYPLFMQRTFHSSWDGSLRARAGKYWGRTMLYGTAGIAAMHVTVDARDSTSSGSVTSQISVQIPTLAWVPSRTVSSGSHLHPGFTIGGGAQRAVTPRIDVAIEYRYSAFASHKYQNCTTDTTVVFASTQFVEHRTSCASLVGGASPEPGAPADIIQSAANVIRPSRAQLIARVLFKQPWW